MNSNRTLYKLLRVIFPEVLMEYFDISGWYDGSDKIEVWLDEKHYLERSDYKSGTVICIQSGYNLASLFGLVWPDGGFEGGMLMG